jgi:hypothetical protein
MRDSLAFRIGEIAGAVITLLLFLAIGVFFVIALVKAIKTRRTGWIVAASVCGLPFLSIMAAFLIGVVIGVTRVIKHPANPPATRHSRPTDLLEATMTSVTGNALPYEISLPSLGAWKRNEQNATFDLLFGYRDAYVGIIAENVGMGTPERLCNFTRGNLEKKASRCTTTPPIHVEINGRTWLTYDADVTIDGMDLKFRYYVYADAKYSVQILTWTGSALFEGYEPVFDRIARSFKFPEPKDDR